MHTFMKRKLIHSHRIYEKHTLLNTSRYMISYVYINTLFYRMTVSLDIIKYIDSALVLGARILVCRNVSTWRKGSSHVFFALFPSLKSLIFLSELHAYLYCILWRMCRFVCRKSKYGLNIGQIEGRFC